ncbi:hypothetical protein GCM10017581_099390 [Dactylosporangium matsuzakiense]|uniref:Glyoxalase-like domain-containing protein n=2 Tax=Dactylosporangium TaxID=35753 RepID=A0A9W6KWW8_9ACTN|nr:hypothetical protein GCM10017581_099390 [Dactylosporangium matsuzakiense]
MLIDQLLRAFGQEGLTEEFVCFAICMFASRGRRKGTKLPNPPRPLGGCDGGRRGVWWVPIVHGGGVFMGSRWYALIVDAVDPERLGRWWAEVLDHRVESASPREVVIGPDIDGHPRIVFNLHDGEELPRNRLHLDLRPDDLDAELERLVNMGARHVDVAEPENAAWVMLADPEGNEFCIIRPKR